MAIAGLWSEAEDGALSFTMLTTAPGPDIAPYHDRQVCVLPPEDWAAWLFLTRPEDELLKPLPAGSLDVGDGPGRRLAFGLHDGLVQRLQKALPVPGGKAGVEAAALAVSRRCWLSSRMASAMPIESGVKGRPVGPSTTAPLVDGAAGQRNIRRHDDIARRRMLDDPVVGRVGACGTTMLRISGSRDGRNPKFATRW